MLKRFTAIAFFLALALPATSFAINFCGSAGTCGAPIEVTPGSTGVSLQLFFNTEAATALAFGGNVLAGGSTALVSFSNGGSLPPGGCANGPISGQSFGWACGDGSTMNPGNSYHFATLVFNAGGIGDDIVLQSGTYLSQGFSEPSVDNVGATLVTIVPEPGAVVLLGAGLAGLAFLRRKRA